VLEYIGEIKDSAIHDTNLVAELHTRYQNWHRAARVRLDGWAEQCPEFVSDMQELLAERLILSVEIKALERDMADGSIPHATGEAMLADLRGLSEP
jgi:hypothetical protein